MTLPFIRQRVDRLAYHGYLTQALAERLYPSSPYHRQSDGNRANRTWLTARPHPPTDWADEELLEKWGGESVYAASLDDSTKALLRAIGHPQAIELELPLSLTPRASCAAENAIDAWSQHLGIEDVWGGGADMVAVRPVQARLVRAFHGEDSGLLARHADGYLAKHPPRVARVTGHILGEHVNSRT